MENKRNNLWRGFTLLEMAAVVTVLIILSGIVIPIANGLIEDAKVTRTLDLVEKVANASRRYFADTGKTPMDLDDLWTAPAGIEGWNGPYIDRPVDTGDNPFLGPIDLLEAGWNFKLTPNDPVDPGKSSSGLALEIHEVPKTSVAKIETAIDYDDNKEGGKVYYIEDTMDPEGRSKVIFYLMPLNL